MPLLPENNHLKPSSSQESSILPFEKLISLLKSENFIVDARDYVEFTAVFNQFSNQKTPEQLKYYLAPIICRNAEEQLKFYQLFDSCFTKTAKNTQHSPFLLPLALSAITLFIIAVLYFLYSWRSPVPAQINYQPTNKEIRLNDTVLFYRTIDAERPSNPQAIQWTFDSTKFENKDSILYVFKSEGIHRILLEVTDEKNQKSLDSLTLSVYCQQPLLTVITNPIFINKTVLIRADSLEKVPIQKSAFWSIRNEKDSLLETRTFSENTFNFIPTQKGNYTVSLSTDAQGSCSGTIDIKVEEDISYTVRFSPSGEPISSKTAFNTWYNYLMSLLLLGVVVSAILYYGIKRTPPPVEESFTDYNGLGPPDRIPFQPKDKHINSEANLIKVAYRLQQKVWSDIPELNIHGTILNTIRNYGIVTPAYRNRPQEREYLILMDESTKNSQYVSLFQYLLKVFTVGNVKIDYYFFYKKPDNFYKEKSRISCNFKDLHERHQKSIVLLFGTGHNLLHSFLPIIVPDLAKGYKQWDKQILVTPIAYQDWGAEEEILAKSFPILPADIIGLMDLVQLIGEEKPESFSLNRKKWKTYQTKYVDVRDISELKAYLNDNDLFQWLCAICVHYEIRWEVIVDIGRNILNTSHVGYKLNYTNLLKLSRISWIANGAFPTGIRLELLANLTTSNELVARQAILRLLAESDNEIDSTSFSYEEKTIQKYTDSFVLYANNQDEYKTYKEDAEKFIGLWNNQQVADTAQYVYLENKNKEWETPIRLSTNDSKRVGIVEYITEFSENKAKHQSESKKRKFKKLIPFGLALLSLSALWAGIYYFQQEIAKWPANNVLKIVQNVESDSTFVRFAIQRNDCLRNFANGDSTLTLGFASAQKDFSLTPSKVNDNYTEVMIGKVNTQDLKGEISLTFTKKNGSQLTATNTYENAYKAYKYTLTCLKPTSLIAPDTTKPKPIDTPTSATLPDFMNEIWSAGIANRLVSFDFKRNVMYYSYGDATTYATYSIKPSQSTPRITRTKSGAYKIDDLANNGQIMFFIKNINAQNRSFDLSACQISKELPLEERKKMDESSCTDFNRMTLHYENDPNKIFYPMRGNQLEQREKIKLNKIGYGQTVRITHYTGKHERPVSIAANYLKSRGVNVLIGSKTPITNSLPFQRDYDVIEVVERGYSILWVDDHPENNSELIATFKDYKISIDTVFTNREALSKIENNTYDLIITDVKRDKNETGTKDNTNEYGGILLIEQLKKRNYKGRIVVFSDSALKYEKDIRGLGVPIVTFDELKQLVLGALQNKGTR